MKRTLALAALIAFPLCARAEIHRAWPNFIFRGADQIRVEMPPVEAPAGEAADVLAKRHMIAHAGTDSLYAYVSSPMQFAEAASFWSQALLAAGLRPEAAVERANMMELPYSSPNGLKLRNFTANTRQFAAGDENALRANMAMMTQALLSAGLKPLPGHVIALEGQVPTYSILHLVAPKARPEEEIRARLLNIGGDIDPEMLEAAGVRVVQKPQPGLTVYIGAALGASAVMASTREELDVLIARKKAKLEAEGKKFVGRKIYEIDGLFGAQLVFFL